jgi:hypothetical protein
VIPARAFPNKGGRNVCLTKLADILYFCVKVPRLPSDVVAKFGMSQDSARVILGHMRTLGLLRITQWRLSGNRHGPYMATYSLANGQPDVAKPEVYLRPGTKLRPPRRTRTQPGKDLLRLAAVLGVIRLEHSSIEEVAIETGMNRDTVRRLLNHIRGRLAFVKK